MSTAIHNGVLLLNASYEALRVIPMRRAVVLILQEKADIVKGDPEEPLISSAFEIVINERPLVIKLKNFVKIPWKATVALNRRTLAARDHGTCQVEGCQKVGNTIDHLLPRSRGGLHEWLNVVLMCGDHNFKKKDHTLEEMGWTLKKAPSVPARGTHILVGVATLDPSWEKHLGLAY